MELKKNKDILVATEDLREATDLIGNLLKNNYSVLCSCPNNSSKLYIIEAHLVERKENGEE